MLTLTMTLIPVLNFNHDTPLTTAIAGNHAVLCLRRFSVSLKIILKTGPNPFYFV